MCRVCGAVIAETGGNALHERETAGLGRHGDHPTAAALTSVEAEIEASRRATGKRYPTLRFCCVVGCWPATWRSAFGMCHGELTGDLRQAVRLDVVLGEDFAPVTVDDKLAGRGDDSVDDVVRVVASVGHDFRKPVRPVGQIQSGRGVVTGTMGRCWQRSDGSRATAALAYRVVFFFSCGGTPSRHFCYCFKTVREIESGTGCATSPSP